MSKIHDLSFAGSTIVIDGISIRDFIDDANPVDIQDTEVSNIEWSCNGLMIRTIKPSAVMMSVTVIPGSPSDKSLRRRFADNFCNAGNCSLEEANKSISASISPANPNVPSYTFTGGTYVSGAAAVSVSAQGKMGGNTYTFAFEQIV